MRIQTATISTDYVAQDTSLANLSDSSKNPELVQSLEKVINYISDKVAEKVSSKVQNTIHSSELVETPQNGFDAVNQAANIMADSSKNEMTGGNVMTGCKKKKKTRKFRLVKNNKSRSK